MVFISFFNFLELHFICRLVGLLIKVLGQWWSSSLCKSKLQSVYSFCQFLLVIVSVMDVGYVGVNKIKVLGYGGKWYQRRDTFAKGKALPTGHRYVCPEGCGDSMLKSFLDNGPSTSNCGQLIVHKVDVLVIQLFLFILVMEDKDGS